MHTEQRNMDARCEAESLSGTGDGSVAQAKSVTSAREQGMDQDRRAVCASCKWWQSE